jgi:putative membrane protein (TIGR04086 family)
VALPDSIDPAALRRGIVVSGSLAVALAVVSGLIWRQRNASEHRGALTLVSLAVLVVLAAGAYIAAKRQTTGTPMMHGIITSIAVVALLTIVRVLWNAFDNTRTPLSFASVVSNLLLAIVCGIVGGVIGGRHGRSPATHL